MFNYLERLDRLQKILQTFVNDLTSTIFLLQTFLNTKKVPKSRNFLPTKLATNKLIQYSVPQQLENLKVSTNTYCLVKDRVLTKLALSNQCSQKDKNLQTFEPELALYFNSFSKCGIIVKRGTLSPSNHQYNI